MRFVQLLDLHDSLYKHHDADLSAAEPGASGPVLHERGALPVQNAHDRLHGVDLRCSRLGDRAGACPPRRSPEGEEETAGGSADAAQRPARVGRLQKAESAEGRLARAQAGAKRRADREQRVREDHVHKVRPEAD